MLQHGNEVYMAGAFNDLENCNPNTTSTNYNCTGDFGGNVHFKDVAGTIGFNDTTLTVDTAYGVHERLIQAGAVPSRVLNSWGNGATWLHSWGPTFDNFVFTVDLGPLSQASLSIDNITTATTSTANTSISETAHWIDPKTHQLIPSAWHAWADLENGRVDNYLTAFGRLYYYWLRKEGLIMIYQIMCDSESTFTYPNGSFITEKQVAFVEYFRTIYISTPNPKTPLNSTN